VVTSLHTFLPNFYGLLLLSYLLLLYLSHLPLFDHPDNVWCKVQIIKTLSQHPVLKHHKFVLFSHGETKFCINERTRWAMYIKCNTVACSHNV
jgi:hypothetical protein